MSYSKIKISPLLFLILFIIPWRPGYAIEKQKQSRVNSAEVYGAKKLAEQQVLEKLSLNKGSVFDVDQLPARIHELLSAYTDSGMPFTTLDSLTYHFSPDSLRVDVRIYLSEGRPAKIDKIQITGIDSSKAQTMQDQIAIRRGGEFNSQQFANEMEGVVTSLENSGYAFARLDIDSIKVDTAGQKTEDLEIILNARLGPKLRLEEFQIEGNDLTKDKIIIRETRIKAGEIFSHKKVSRIRPRLLRLGYFDSVDEPQVYVDKGDRGGLLLRVKEGTASRFDGVLGYNPGTDNEKGYFTGLLDVSLGNLLGTGRSILAHWEKRDQKTQQLQFHYKEPWVLGFPVNLSFGFEQLIQDTTYVQRDWQLNGDLPVSEELMAFVRGHRLEVTPDSLGSFTYGLPNSRTFSFILGLDYDTRDSQINPRRGVRYNTTFEVGRKKNLGPQSIIEQFDLRTDIDNKKLTLDFEWYFPLLRLQVLSMAVHGRQIKSNEHLIPLTDQFRFGGARTMRGYREDQFRGSQVAWANLEYRYLLGRRSRVFLFLDSGYYSREEESGRKDSYKVGYGLGVRLETGLGIMGVDYGLGEGDGFFAGKVHVGLINEF